MFPRGRAFLRRLLSSRNRARARLCRRLCHKRRRVRQKRRKERRNEHVTRSAARSHHLSDHQSHPEAIAHHRRRRERDRAVPRLYEPDRLLPRIPALIHGLVGHMPWVDGHRHGPPHDRRRMGHGDPAHPRGLHAHAAAADPAVHSSALCRAQALSVGDAARFHHRSVIYFAIWFVLQYLLSKFSFEHDQPPFADTSARFKIVSAPGIILYTLTISFAAIDWVMSLNPS